MADIRKNTVHTLDITGYSAEGMGVARLEGLVVFVPYTIRGERWRVRLEKVNKHAAWGRGTQLLLPSPERITPDCPLYGRCGGCQFRHMSYAEELRAKGQRVADALERVGHTSLELPGVLGAEHPDRYRNKVQFPVSQGRRGLSVGYFRPRSHDVLDAPDCPLQPEAVTRLRAAFKGWMEEYAILPYDEGSRRGLVRHLYVRTNSRGESLVCVVANGDRLPQTGALVDLLRQAEPRLAGVVLNTNTRDTNVILGDSYTTLWGRDWLEEELCQLTFRLSVPSFFQINRAQTQRLYGIVLDFAQLTGSETVLDLYCGIGTISLALAKQAGRVIGAEIVPQAIEDACENARRNGVENADFFCGDAGATAKKLAGEGIRPQVICVDPPRKGLAPDVPAILAGMAPQRIVYVSCDPATLARDVDRFAQLGYQAVKAQAVDLFPRTAHVETVCLLSKLKAEHHIGADLDLEEIDLPDIKKFDIPSGAQHILQALTDAGYEAYLVGGCVRDLLRGIAPHDWDICTSARPKETERCFTGHRIIETGLKHGTVTVLEGGEPYEVTTYRTEGPYSDSRRPDYVEFVSSLEADLARRDFTMNAIALGVEGGLRDPFGGADDIKAGVIRCVGEPVHRFQEDGLRVMRALRFGAVFGYEIEEKTAQAIHDNRAVLTHVAAERIHVELCKLLVGDKAGDILRQYPDVMYQFWPDLEPLVTLEQNTPWHCWGGWEHTIHAVEAAPPDLILRLTMLLHDIGKPLCKSTGEDGIDHFYGHPAVSAKLANRLLRALKFDNSTRERVVTLVKYHDVQIPLRDRSVRKWLGRLGPEAFFQLLEVKRADGMGQAHELVKDRLSELEALKSMAEEMVAQGQCFSLKDLAVNGRDIIAAGVAPGPEVGRVLNRLLEWVLDGEVPNQRDALLNRIDSAL